VVAFSGNLDPQTLPTVITAPSHGERPAGERPAPRAARPPEPRLEEPSLDRSLDRSFDAAVEPRGKVIVFFGCRGGAGATMLSVNVGAQLVRSGKSVCVLDLDLQLGDVFVALDLEPTTSISALAREADKLDASGLRRRLVRHDSGVYALSQTGRLDDVDPALAERMPGLIRALRENFDYVIVDGVRDFGDHALAAMDVADKIALVLTQDVQAVRRAARVGQIFRRLGYPDKKIHLILNRHTSRSHVDEAEIERVLGLPVTAFVRNDYERMRKALDEGSLLQDVARGAGVARDVEQAARTLQSDPQRGRRVRDDDEKAGFFAKLFGRK
jgi:pilus assembly protein CpaE